MINPKEAGKALREYLETVSDEEFRADMQRYGLWSEEEPMQNNPHSPQEPQRGRTLLDEAKSFIAKFKAAQESGRLDINHGVRLPVELAANFVALAVACRDAKGWLESVERSPRIDGTYAESILTSLRPLLQPIDAPEGDEAGGV